MYDFVIKISYTFVKDSNVCMLLEEKCIFSFRAGANLQENSPVEDAVFDDGTGLWTIKIEGSDKTYKARVCNSTLSFELISYGCQLLCCYLMDNN